MKRKECNPKMVGKFSPERNPGDQTFWPKSSYALLRVSQSVSQFVRHPVVVALAMKFDLFAKESGASEYGV